MFLAFAHVVLSCSRCWNPVSDSGPLAKGVVGASALTPTPVAVDASLKPASTKHVGHLEKSGTLEAMVAVMVLRHLPGTDTGTGT